jgi:genome maintenance exonuclease 1
MTFVHATPYEISKLNRVEEGGKRYYLTPSGNKYPSVTTVSSIFAKEGIIEWRKSVGEEEATKITTQAAVRGTAVHKLCEDYINNDANYLTGHMPVNIESFNNIKPLLDKSISNVVMLECPLYSDYLRVAGTVDCIAEWNGRLSIIDFKTSRKVKKRDWIENYFMQEAAYAVMFEERTGKKVSQLVTVIAVDNEDPQVFIEHRDEWIWKFIDARSEFERRYGI